MNQLHKIDNINNDFLQRCFFFLNTVNLQMWLMKRSHERGVIISSYDFLRLLLSLNSWPWLKNYVCNNIYD